MEEPWKNSRLRHLLLFSHMHMGHTRVALMVVWRVSVIRDRLIQRMGVGVIDELGLHFVRFLILMELVDWRSVAVALWENYDGKHYCYIDNYEEKEVFTMKHKK